MKRSNYVVVRVTPEEMARIKEKSSSEKMTVSELVRKLILK
jgi:predicted DNA binding CopG/RHH family protein